MRTVRAILKDEDQEDHAEIPLRYVGPLSLRGDVTEEDLYVPLATYESPLWPSVERGFRVAGKNGIFVSHQGQGMTRSFALTAPSASKAIEYKKLISESDISSVISSTSRYAKFRSLHVETVGRNIFIRLCVETGDAAGHNMTTKAAHAVLTHFLDQYGDLEYGTISANLCTDKKVSFVNSFTGRGHNVVASATISEKLCERFLRTEPSRLKELHIQKNLLGSILAGSVRSANAHVANILLGVYLATGQDAANIVEGSQAITHVDVTHDGGLEISCHLPNLVMGTVGSGKGYPHVKEAYERLGCRPDKDKVGKSSKRLAMITAAACLAGELSLLAAQTNKDELLASHELLERRHKNS